MKIAGLLIVTTIIAIALTLLVVFVQPVESLGLEFATDAQSMIFSTTQDTFVSYASPNSNYGSAANYSLGWTSLGEDYRALLDFDIASLPANAQVISATLTLKTDINQAGASLSPEAIFYVYPYAINTAWNEGTVTWNNKPASTHWNDPRATVNTTASTVKWSVTELVKAWVAGQQPVEGILLLNDQTVDGYMQFISKEGSTINAAKLEIAYNLITPTVTPSRTNTPRNTSTFTPTQTPKITSTYTPTSTRTKTATFTSTSTITQTPLITLTPTSTNTQTPTRTRTATSTITQTLTRTRTPTATYTVTQTPVITHTRTPSPTTTKTATRTPSPTPTQDLVCGSIPVRIDIFKDTWVDSTNPSKNYGLDNVLKVGSQAGTAQSLFHFASSLEIPTGSVLSEATLYLYLNAIQPGPGAYQLRSASLTTGWNEAIVSWSNKPEVKTNYPMNSFTGETGWVGVNITPITQGFFSGQISNTGFYLLPAVGTFNAEFASRESNNAPYVMVKCNGLPTPTKTPTATRTVGPTATNTLPAPQSINFENFPAGTNIIEQYASQGVHFYNDYLTSARFWAAPQILVHPYASSGTRVLANQYYDPEVANSANVSMVFWFDTPQKTVSFNLTALGNAYTNCKSMIPATIRAYNCSGVKATEVVVNAGDSFYLPVTLTGSSAGNISFVAVDFGSSTCAEAIDDLNFTGGNSACNGSTTLPSITITSGDTGSVFPDPDQFMTGYIDYSSGMVKRSTLNGSYLPTRFNLADRRISFNYPIELHSGVNQYTLQAVALNEVKKSETVSYLLNAPDHAIIYKLNLTQRGVVINSNCGIDDPFVAGKSTLALLNLRVFTADTAFTFVDQVKVNIYRTPLSGMTDEILVDSLWSTSYDGRIRFNSVEDMKEVHFWIPGSMTSQPGMYRLEYQPYLSNQPIGPPLTSACSGGSYPFYNTSPIRPLFIPSSVGSTNPASLESGFPQAFLTQLEVIRRTFPIADYNWDSLPYLETDAYPMCDGTLDTKNAWPSVCKGTGFTWAYKIEGVSSLSQMSWGYVTDPLADACSNKDFIMGGGDLGLPLNTISVNPIIGVLLFGPGINGWDNYILPKFMPPIDMDGNGQLSNSEMLNYIKSYYDVQTNQWYNAADFSHYSPGDTIRFFEDTSGDNCAQSYEPIAPIRSRSDGNVLYKPPVLAMTNLNATIPGTANDFDFPFLVMPDIFVPPGFLWSQAQLGQSSGGTCWVETLPESTVFAHELGHAMGGLPDRYNDSIPDYLSVQESAVTWFYSGRTRYDPRIVGLIMGGDTNNLMSVNLDHDYQNLFDDLVIPAGAQTVEVLNADPVFHLSFDLIEDGSVDGLVYQVAEGLELTPQDPGSPYALVFGNGVDILSQHPFTTTIPYFPPEGGGMDNPPSTFTVIASYPPASTWVELRNDETVLTRLDVSANAPTITLLEPNGGESYASDEIVTIRWNNQDLDGNDLDHSLFYSTDNGITWILLTAAYRGNEYRWDLGNLPGTMGNQGLVKVIASDGFHSASDISDTPFTVAGKPPVAAILSPQPGTEILACGNLSLEGLARDPEGQPLTYAWKIDETVVSTELSGFVETAGPGQYTLAFEVTDQDGYTTRKEVSFSVGDDSDCDGMPDAYESQYGLNPLYAGDAGEDPDNDGLTNRVEYFLGTNPTLWDTDGDGFSDGYEFEMGTDPLDPESHPIPFLYLPVILR